MAEAGGNGSRADPAGNRGIITVCVMLATIMQALDTTIANVALPYMQGNMSASQDQINWVLTSYIVAAAIMTPPTGWLAGRFGRKRVLLVAVAGFTAASVLCGMAQSLGQIVLFRLLQGCFGASLVPLSQSVLLSTYPRERHGWAMAIWGVGVMVGPILGPTLGGWLTEYYTWRWVFYINVPVGALAFAGISTFLTETPRSTQRLDWLGFALLSVSIGALQLVLDRGEQLDWFGSTEIIAEAIASGLAFYLFLVHIATADNPFVSPALFRDRNFCAGLCFIFMVGVVLLTTLALLTPFLQDLMNYPVLTAGLMLAPRGVGTMAGMLMVGRLIGMVDTRAIILFGLALTAWALWDMTGFTPDVSEATLVRTGVVQGLGLGFIFVPLSAVTFSTLAPSRIPEAAGLYNLMRNIGSSIGISVTATLLDQHTQISHSEIAAGITATNAQLNAPGVASWWSPYTAAGRAALDAEITRQATTIAYIDDFKLLMYVALLALPLLLLLRKPQGSSGGTDPAAAAMD
ncbi:MAG: DHA2 family efflux MFS transporter permease subunit [Alphaproteobacteria bacterium]|nr:DHA2 family efflux MFS transporter permease subunit [Alphaproteobacteria bacterium]